MLYRSEFELLIRIHVQHEHRRPTNGGSAHDVRSLKSEMILPQL